MSVTKPEKLAHHHALAQFSCGRESLDDWLKNRALKSSTAGDSKVFVVNNDEREVVGYYAISAASVVRKNAISKLRRNAPDPIPMGLIGRLVVHKEMQGRGLGPALLRDAILRIAQASAHMGIKGILTHAIDEEAAKFYAHHGFSPSPINDHHLMVSLCEIAAELSGCDFSHLGGSEPQLKGIPRRR